MNYYLIQLSGQGDIELKLVTEENWNWVINPNLPVPEKIVSDYEKRYGDKFYFKPSGRLYPDQNEAALAVPGEHWFSSVAAFVKFIQDHNIRILDTYEGSIY